MLEFLGAYAVSSILGGGLIFALVIYFIFFRGK